MTILMAEGRDRKVMMGSDGLGPNPSVAVTSDTRLLGFSVPRCSQL